MCVFCLVECETFGILHHGIGREWTLPAVQRERERGKERETEREGEGEGEIGLRASIRAAAGEG